MAARGGLSRRALLATSAKGAVALGVGSMWGARTASAARRTMGANDRITLGLIGSGDRGTGDANSCCLAKNVVCAALCDVAEFRLDYAAKVLSKTMETRGHPDVKIDRFDDFRRLLDRRDIDAVVIATPDFWHKEPFIAAVEAGKHIYQEKPFSFSIEHGQAMGEAAKKQPELTIQVGTQRRSGAHYVKAKALIAEGKLGQVKFVRTFDCRNWINDDPYTPENTSRRFMGTEADWTKLKIDWDRFQSPCAQKRPFDPWRYCAWRWFWDYAGGLVTDVGVHVMDNVHWLLGEPTPRSAVCNGGVYALKYWETPDVVNAVWDYGDYSISFVGNFTNGFEGDGFVIYGTQATMEVRGEAVKVYGEGKRDEPIAHYKPEGVDHRHNWIQCIRSGEQTNAPAELGVTSLLPSHLANLAYRKGSRVTWDAAAQKAV